MKKVALILISSMLLASCAKEKSVEERYVYDVDKVIDIETGDEYFLEDDGEITVVYSDGKREKIPVEDVPFFESSLSDEFMRSLEANLEQRKQRILEEKKEQIKEVRRSRYANISDEELLRLFQQAHKDGLDLSRQMDMIAELIDRNVVSSDDAPDLLKIAPELIDFDFVLEETDEN